MPILVSTIDRSLSKAHRGHRRPLRLVVSIILLVNLAVSVRSQAVEPAAAPVVIDPNSIQPLGSSSAFLVNQFPASNSMIRDHHANAAEHFGEDAEAEEPPIGDDVHAPPAAAAPHHLEQPNYEQLSCYDARTGKARKCMPEFVNAAFNQRIHSSNTCGQRQPIEYCVQSNLMYSKNPNYFYALNDSLYGGGGGASSSGSPFSESGRINSRCYKCDFNTHSTSYLTDYNNPHNLTWWQSETMLESVQYPTTVNLTLNLGKSYEINYVQVKFQSSRPESFAIYKRTSETSPWEPYQYYSASCMETYNVNPGQIVTHQNEAIALCTDEFSDIAPLSGASVVFGTLEDRPSAYNFENSPQLKEWVTATDIRISLNRLNTFGDEVFNDPHVLKSYYYAISDIAVGGRCKCNGHANRCVYEQQEDFEDRLVCKCEHNTAGVDCEQCLPFFNDAPWAPATQFDANECKPCSCNGLSKKCHFNQTLYDLTGHGGYCDECEGNTGGPNCEECKFGFYRRENEMRCIDCQCHPFGAESAQCDPSGKCRCKPGVVGDKCDRCAPYHYELSVTGCKMCTCNPIGSFDQPPICDPRDGSCRCKANVEGQNCDRPKPGFFDLAPENQNGALPCFCYGHSSICNSSADFHVHEVRARFDESSRWQAVDSYGQPVSVEVDFDDYASVHVQSSTNDDVWFLAPADFLGNQLHSYGQNLTFDLRLVDLNQQQTYVQAVRPSRKDVVLHSAHYNLEVYMPIYGSGSSARNQLPSHETQSFAFKLDQYSGWMPTLASHDFQRMLTNLSSIKIRASYVPSSRAILSRLSLDSAQKNANERERDQLKQALFVEECRCPVGHVGQHCESCADGYHREPHNGGPFARCVPCNCNNHSVSCDADTGRCACMHHTSGDNCEKCQEGYYGNPIPPVVTDSHHLHHHSSHHQLSENELANMCKKCPCPNDGPCAEIFNYQLNSVEVVCLACPPGTQGNLCELCDDGYHRVGGATILTSRCERCECNGNIDENAVGNCDAQSNVERCLRCVYNTTGERCDECLPGYWGNALSSLKCHSCDCYPLGTVEEDAVNRPGEPKQCNLQDGFCECKPNVKNRQCDQCKEGYWNILSGKGCEECRCNPLGSFNLSCDALSGQCYCRPGVQGLKCDSCRPLHFGFSEEGCRKCDCDPFGTSFQSGLQCDDFGKCTCKPNFAGLKCNKCAENRFNYTSGCLECDQCYNLVQDQVNALRSKIALIQAALRELWKSSVDASSGIQSDESVKLQNKLNTLRVMIDELHANFFEKQYLKPTYRESINHLQSELKRISESIKSTDQMFDQFHVIFKQAETLYNQANQTVFQIQTQLNFIDEKNGDRHNKLDAIKQARLDHEQNIRLQNLAKQARETADKQKQISQNMSQELQSIVAESHSAVKKLDELLVKYAQLETEDPSLNYKELRDATNVLIAEASEQKTLLDKSSVEIDELVRKLKQVKIPDEAVMEAENQRTRAAVTGLTSKTSSLRREIDELKSKFEQFANVDSINSIGEAQTRLNNAQMKHQEISYLYKTAERTRNETDKANALAKEVHANASNILRTLEKFDELISSGKEKVARAELLKPKIEENLQGSNTLLGELNSQLSLLNAKLNDIKFISARSQSMLIEANKTVEKLDQKVGELKNSSTRLEQSTSELKTAFDTSLKSRAIEGLATYQQLSSRSDSVLKQAEQVTNETQRLLDNANNAVESLNKINESLNQFSVSNIKRDEIVRLKQKFEQISLQLDNDYQIDESISSLERNSKDLLSTAKQYQYQVDFLQKQVENLEEINNSLERKCFANTVVKPEL